MNIYQVSPKYSEYGDNFNLFFHVVAPTRNRAWVLTVSYINDFFNGAEYLDPHRAKILEKNVDMREGVDKDYSWAKAHGIELEIWEDG